METLTSFDFKVQFRQGTQHGNAHITHVDKNGKPFMANEIEQRPVFINFFLLGWSLISSSVLITKTQSLKSKELLKYNRILI